MTGVLPVACSVNHVPFCAPPDKAIGHHLGPEEDDSRRWTAWSPVGEGKEPEQVGDEKTCPSGEV